MQANMARYILFIQTTEHINIQNYTELHTWSITYPEKFWPSILNFFDIPLHTPAQTILNNYKHIWEVEWFKGATLNYAQQLLRINNQSLALICLNESGYRHTVTYAQLNQLVAECAQEVRKVVA